ncbi:DUF1851 domain-containing protein [Novosphingobium sp. 1949]|uniref:DUF1851 domain-containing protein n=1 Tax=Novosphingobium organovorum TaxID=2930092 RepID=A0ABT0BGJ3_9SPHN|nr:DUF1851 domain-containing protein [Novosphingobium organovorum]MCJ2184149.1 DUF1851 domain-containing protein [Novosphingobium organovorum]
MRARELAALRQAWGWCGVDFAEIVAHSLFGHVLAIDTAGNYHYLDPELLCLTALGDEKAASAHMAQAQTKAIWRADAHVAKADKALGATTLGEVYGFTPAALIAGDYDAANMIRVELALYIRLTGDIAQQVQDLPEGAHVEIKVSD